MGAMALAIGDAQFATPATAQSSIEHAPPDRLFGRPS
jgi:hypothetical protein